MIDVRCEIPGTTGTEAPRIQHTHRGDHEEGRPTAFSPRRLAPLAATARGAAAALRRGRARPARLGRDADADAAVLVRRGGRRAPSGRARRQLVRRRRRSPHRPRAPRAGREARSRRRRASDLGLDRGDARLLRRRGGGDRPRRPRRGHRREPRVLGRARSTGTRSARSNGARSISRPRTRSQR